MYKEGQGIRQSDAKAIKWYRRAAKQGLAEAQFNLGLIYEEGNGVIQNVSKAEEWFHKAADR